MHLQHVMCPRGNVHGKMHAVPACLAVSKVRVVAAAAAWADRFSMCSVSCECV